MQRKLAAILSADVVGYSAMMEADEAGTLERLKANRARVFDPCVATHRGRLIKLMGDGALIEFASAVDAVNCALALQEGMSRDESGSEHDAATRLVYRIGVNLGDVIVDGDDLYGEGVNVAARLQALAPAGGVALSQTVRDHVEGKVSCTFQDAGQHQVKNIQRPVSVFILRPLGTEIENRASAEELRRVGICVLPFANMSGEVEQEYFSDGISEDIITDLSKVSALSVTARNTAFTFKGKAVDVRQVARQLKVSHILEGSVRKAGARVRITAQLIDGASGDHIWAERYDRDLSNIFALQDEISEAIVGALKIKLLPEEREAIEKRGTNNAEAYNLYLMARQYSVTGNFGNAHRNEAVVRLCQKAIEIDPGYARAWALMACAQGSLRIFLGREGDGGVAAAERALSLDENLAEAHAAKAAVLISKADYDGALPEIEIALRLDPGSYEVNVAAARWNYATNRLEQAIRYFENAASLMETDYWAPGMLIACYHKLGDAEGETRSARLALARVEKAVAQDPGSGSAMSFGITALAHLGQLERAKEWTVRAMLLDPDNLNMLYNNACTMIVLRDYDAALEMLTPGFEKLGVEAVNWAKADPDLDPIREDPRFKAMMAAAEARLASVAKT